MAVVLLNHQYEEDRNDLHHPCHLNHPTILCHHQVLVPLLQENHDTWQSIIIPQIWWSTRFHFIITFPTFGHDWEPHYCQQWQRWYQEFAQLSKLSWGAIDVHNPFSTTPSLSRLYRPMTFLLQLSSIHLRPLFNEHSSLSSIWLPKSLKPVTSVLVGDNVTNSSFLLDHHDWHNYALPFLFYLSDMSLPTGIHELPNTCLTCVCLMVNVPLPCSYHMLNMRLVHVYLYSLLVFKSVV
jgi:hypothetical protein